ncbi:MAG TPA: hypothetical protein VEZ41_10475 [Allosphingosinicella sp.]|jgi:hypothetical protein|nr:hypothetical protein [Allosphingosinicella sp.]
MKTSRRTISIILGLGWAASLALPVATLGDGQGELWYGWTVLLLGWLGIFLGQFAWIANFLFAAALLLLVRGRPPLVWGMMIGVLTSLLAAHALSWTTIYQTGGGTAPILAYWSGFYLWVLVTFLGGAALCVASIEEVRHSGPATRAV